jgi:transcription termination factor Rho
MKTRGRPSSPPAEGADYSDNVPAQVKEATEKVSKPDATSSDDASKSPVPGDEDRGGKENRDNPQSSDGSGSGDRPNTGKKRFSNNQQRQRGKQHQRQNNQNQRKNKRQGGRRKGRAPMDFVDEKRPLVLGNLLELELLRNPDELEALATVAAGEGSEEINFNDLYVLDLQELKERAVALGVELGTAPIREEVLDAILHRAHEQKTPVKVTGILEVMEEGHGLLLQAKDSYRIKSHSAFVPPLLVKRFGLQTGHELEALLSPKTEGVTCPLAVRVLAVMGEDPSDAAKTVPFTDLVPYYPLERMFMETNADSEWDNVSMRVVDLVSPVGFGQRGLIVAQPRTGKTVLLQGIAHAIRQNNPDTHLMILLIDERPEEVTDFKRQISDAEVISSTFDERAESHVHATEIVIERARRMVEVGKHVVILLDSITRMARAYNTTMPNSGKILSGGVEANALQRPKRFFGSARNIEGGGSLSILATALVETGSKMDEVIFEEFKGTGNMELHLDRELVNKRIFPAIAFDMSGTRKEELLYHPDELDKVYGLRRSLKGVPPAEAMEMFIQRVKKTKSNAEFLMSLGR